MSFLDDIREYSFQVIWGSGEPHRCPLFVLEGRASGVETGLRSSIASGCSGRGAAWHRSGFVAPWTVDFRPGDGALE